MSEPVRALRKMGRPSDFTQEMAETILRRLCSETVAEVFADPDMPEAATFYNWCFAHPDFFDATARARALGALRELDACEAKLGEATAENIAVVREQAQHARWKVSKLLRRYFGERVEVTGAGGGPVEVRSVVDVKKLSADTLRRLAEELDGGGE